MQISYQQIVQKFLEAGGRLKSKSKFSTDPHSELGQLLMQEMTKILKFIGSQPADLFGHQTVTVQDLVPFFDRERNPKSSAKVMLWNLEWMGCVKRVNAGQFSELTVWKLI